MIVFNNGIYDAKKGKLCELSSFYPVIFKVDAGYRGERNHKCELKQAILVKLLYGSHHSGFFGTVFFLTGNVNIFYL